MFEGDPRDKKDKRNEEKDDFERAQDQDRERFERGLIEWAEEDEQNEEDQKD